MKFDNHETDLYILPENDRERKIITIFLNLKGVAYGTSLSNVKGQEWEGKTFFDVPFLKSLKDDLVVFVNNINNL